MPSACDSGVASVGCDRVSDGAAPVVQGGSAIRTLGLGFGGDGLDRGRGRMIGDFGRSWIRRFGDFGRRLDVGRTRCLGRASAVRANAAPASVRRGRCRLFWRGRENGRRGLEHGWVRGGRRRHADRDRHTARCGLDDRIGSERDRVDETARSEHERGVHGRGPGRGPHPPRDRSGARSGARSEAGVGHGAVVRYDSRSVNPRVRSLAPFADTG